MQLPRDYKSRGNLIAEGHILWFPCASELYNQKVVMLHKI